MPTRLTFDDTRARLLAAMPALAGGEFAPADEVGLRHAPAWIGEFGAVRDAASLWLWLDGAAVTRGSEPAMGQTVLDVPEGRYLVESYDVETRSWVSRESAQSPPLVIGIPRRAGPVVLRVTRTAA